MTGKRSSGLLLGLLAAGSIAGAAEGTAKPATVKKEDVKTWIFTLDGKDYSVHPGTPTYLGDTGLFHLPSAYTLPKGKLAASFFRDNLDRDPKDEDISIHGLNLAYGVTSRFELFGSVGLQHRVDADALFQSGFTNDNPFVSTGWETGFGDINVGGKYKFLDDYAGDGVGLALRGHVKLPTADEELGLGTGKVSFGADLVLSKHLNRAADIHGSIGYRVNSDPDGVNIGNAFRWGLGLNVPACRLFQLQAEVTSSVYSGDDDFPQTNPVDLIVGPVVWIKPGIFIRPAVSWNLAFDDRGLNASSKSWTGRQIEIGFHPGTPCCEIEPPPPPPPPPPANKAPTASCEVERAQLLPGESVGVRAVASDPDGDALSYTWSASAGAIKGSGANCTFDATGVAPGTAKITLGVSDGRGGRAEATCPVNIVAPKPKDPINVCNSTGFPRNMDRINNVDKACLDDVASRLRQDPRSRVVVIGHADSTERMPEVIGRKRAEAIKTYLVKERGIAEDRVTARSAAASKPLDSGKSPQARAKNRRAEVIFLPEGAVLPDSD